MSQRMMRAEEMHKATVTTAWLEACHHSSAVSAAGDSGAAAPCSVRHLYHSHHDDGEGSPRSSGSGVPWNEGFSAASEDRGGIHGDIYGGGDVDDYHIEQNFERFIYI